MHRLPDSEKLRICKIYFAIGLFALPSVWLVNGIWFFSQAFCRKPSFLEQRAIRIYVILSLLGAAAWILGVGIWAYIFLSVRKSSKGYLLKIKFHIASLVVS
uniref:Gamma-secretase subunit PEN-2 n=1 Tax=Trichuris muris TaxID=70415 RepID=A0A5S6QJW5_TRIMR